eukprot:CAMPEP_0185857084 /NCGR_PEP_ID=MMETSP1354-20130828/29323_1 /TAXON_ID=708628 /ORGANISM="Erythrolobus madagascarensis, Strain CCMP3276" /LENGTH=354 /DNA_ID=CAMNT_0028559347 /DNA_START=190 /DNA_END=1254 /DNA_ORIENTATION=-
MIRESRVQKLPIDRISVFARGLADVRPLIDPESVEVPRFQSIEMVVYVTLSEGASDDPNGSRARRGAPTRGSVDDVFERTKKKAPVCNSIKYGVPVDVKARVLTSQTERVAQKSNSLLAAVPLADATGNEDLVRLAHETQMVQLEAEGAVGVESLLKYIDADRTRSSIAAFDVEVVAIGPADNLGADLSFSFPGILLGERDDKFRRSQPLAFSASDPDATLKGTASSRAPVERFGEWPDAVSSLVSALGSCLAVSACYKSSGKGRRLTMEQMNVDTVGSWDVDGFMKDEGELKDPVQFWALSCDVGVGVDGDDEERRKKEEELVQMLEMAKKASFVANTLSGKTKLTIGLRIER